MTGKLQDMSEDLEEMKRPSLTKIILSLTTPAKQQEALGHMQTALQIAYARYIVRTHVYIHVHVFSGHVLRCTYIHVSMEAAIIHVHMIETSMLIILHSLCAKLHCTDTSQQKKIIAIFVLNGTHVPLYCV